MQYENVIRELFGQYTEESAKQLTLLRKQLTDIENDIKKCTMKYATDKLDDDAYQMAMEEFKSRKAGTEQELKKYDLNLSNLEDKIRLVIVTCSKLGTLWKQGDLDIKRRIQNLVFPEGILWDKGNRSYRTENCNEFFKLLDGFSMSYGDKKKTPSIEDVSMCAG